MAKKPELKITPVADHPHPIWGGQEWPICVCRGNIAATVTTRYGAMDTTNILTLAHYPMTAVLVEYEKENN